LNPIKYNLRKDTGSADIYEIPKGANAVFAITNWWEHLAKGQTDHESGWLEVEQASKSYALSDGYQIL
jgi:hypothetical protein